MSLKCCFSVPSENFSPGWPSVKKTVLLLRGKGGMKSMKSPYFAIRILQQPNVFKSKMLPPWMRSRTEWVLAAESVSFPKKQNSKITDSTHVAPSEILNHPNRSLFPQVKDTVSLFALSQRQRWWPRVKAWVDIHHPQNHQWCFEVLFTHLFTHQQILFEHCGQAWKIMISKSRFCSTLRECRYGFTAYRLASVNHK